MRNITVNGRLAADVTRQISKQGNEFINFSLANNEYGDPKSSDGNTQTQWFRVTSFQPQHIKLAQHLTKGKPIIVQGRYSDRLYQNQKTGMWDISRDIIATDINFELGGERNNNNSHSGANVASEAKVAHNVATAVEDIPQVTSTKMGQSKTTTAVGQDNVDTAMMGAGSYDDDLPF